jgi:hypothetical protein
LRVRAARAVALPAARTLELFSDSSQRLPSNREARQPHSRLYYFFKWLRAAPQSRFVFPLSRLPGCAFLRGLSAVFRFASESLQGCASLRGLSAVFRFASESLQGLCPKMAILFFIFQNFDIYFLAFSSLPNLK